MKYSKVLKFAVLFLIAIIFSPLTTRAITITIVNPLSSASNIMDVINNLALFFQQILFPLVTLAVLYSAFVFITAGGNEERIAKAKKILVYSLVAGFIAGIATQIESLVRSFF